MTALDQAFIKAYNQPQSEAVVAIPLETKPVRLDEAFGDRPKASGPAVPSPDASKTTVAAGERGRKRTVRPAASAGPSLPQRSRPEAAEELRPGRGRLNAETRTADRPKAEEKSVSLWLADFADAGMATLPAREASTAVPSSSAAPEADSPARPAVPFAQPFRPALRVESFAWPTSTARLARKAAAEMDRLADQFLLGASRGHKVVALAGCQRGEGSTTMLLAAAWRLAERGLCVALVDADFDRPRLAAALGLAPETGWEDVLAGRLPLAEVVIESERDRMVILPLRGNGPRTPGPAADIAADLARLRGHADLVLVDAGEFQGDCELAERFRMAAAGSIDAAVLVHNVRRSNSEELTEALRRLSDAGVRLAGVAENFV